MTTQYPLPVASGMTATAGASQPPICGHEPANRASPKANTPPSESHHEVSAAVGGGDHAHDRGIELAQGPRCAGGSDTETWDRAEEARVSVGEDPTVRGDQPVAAAIGGGRDPHHRALEVHRAGRTVELGRTEAEDPPVSSDEPVAVRRRDGCAAGCGRGGWRLGEREGGDLGPRSEHAGCPTLSVPLPAGTTTLAEVAVAESTWAAASPKLIVACSSPRPEMVTVDPLPPGVTEVTSGHERPPASGEPIPVAASYPTVAAKAPRWTPSCRCCRS